MMLGTAQWSWLDPLSTIARAAVALTAGPAARADWARASRSHWRSAGWSAAILRSVLRRRPSWRFRDSAVRLTIQPAGPSRSGQRVSSRQATNAIRNASRWLPSRVRQETNARTTVSAPTRVAAFSATRCVRPKIGSIHARGGPTWRNDSRPRTADASTATVNGSSSEGASLDGFSLHARRKPARLTPLAAKS